MSPPDSPIQRRRALVSELRELELVEDVDFTRDGFKTVILHLGDDGDVGSIDGRWDGRLDGSDIRKRAMDAWGERAQMNKAAEECSELSAALNRYLNGQQDRDDILAEFIDARIMLWQIALLFGVDELEQALDAGLSDLEDRLEKHG